jgi:formylmethanofuran dehydrogenase subunit E
MEPMRKWLFMFVVGIVSCSPKQGDSIRVNDTDFSKGRLGFQQDIGLDDLVKFHGHRCDGLVVGYQALGEALRALYPDSPADRTNTRTVSQPSPCLTDAAIYLTGGRYQFNSFYASKDVAGLFVVQRLDTGRAVAVSLNEGVKPSEIDRLGSLAVRGELSPCGLDSLRAIEDGFTDFLLRTAPSANFTVRNLEGFEWRPVLKNDYPKTDILNKNQPNCDGGQ